MTIKSPGNPFSGKTNLRHGVDFGCDTCLPGHDHDIDHVDPARMSSEQMPEREVESAIDRSMFGNNDIGHRSFDAVPITCATPNIRAQSMGYHERYGSNAQVTKTAGWAVAPDVTGKSHTIKGKTFDPADPERYVSEFAIGQS
ncbi:ABC transporter substrate-binding protein [Maliponia aquimaris]|nr:ABC transporter substrate-binding protein [Maliponia aquimaris]